MLKKDLLKIIEGIEDEGSVDEVLSQSDFAKSLLSSGLTLDAFKEKLKEPEFKAFLDSEKDTHSNKVLETWKNKNLQTLLDDAVLKATGKKKTPLELKLEENEKKLNEEIQKRESAENTSKVKDMISEAFKDSGIGIEASSLFPFIGISDMENVDKRIGNLKTLLNEGIKTGVETKIKDGNYVPPDNANDGGDTGMSDADLLKIMG